MIIKQGMTAKELRLKLYIRKRRCVYAKRMNEDFIVETGKGWEQGKKGMWLVLTGTDLWSAIEHEQFSGLYWLCDPRVDCDGPCDEHKT